MKIYSLVYSNSESSYTDDLKGYKICMDLDAAESCYQSLQMSLKVKQVCLIQLFVTEFNLETKECTASLIKEERRILPRVLELNKRDKPKPAPAKVIRKVTLESAMAAYGQNWGQLGTGQQAFQMAEQEPQF